MIIYAQRGNCHFADKVLNAQKLGASLVIIGDNNEEDVHKVLPIERTKKLVDSIVTPSILLDKTDADRMRNILTGSNQEIQLAIHFPLVKSNDVADLRMIL